MFETLGFPSGMELHANFQGSEFFVSSVLVFYVNHYERRKAFLLAKLQTATELEFREKEA